MGRELLAVILGLSSAACWGAGDFSGGVASKRSSVYAVVIGSQIAGGLLLFGLAWWLSEPVPPPGVLVYGAIAGVAGAAGLLALYRGLAVGRMGLVAPVAAMVNATIPMLFGFLVDGLPGIRQMAGFGLALPAVWLVSRTGAEGGLQARDLALPVLAGLGFGLFYILIGQVSDTAVLWPLIAARLSSLAFLGGTALLLRQRATPATGQWPLIALIGALDSGGNAFYALATQAGRLDVAVVLGSLHPAATVLLARVVLKESITHLQMTGIALALVAVVLIAS